MRAWLASLWHRLRERRVSLLRIAGVQPLGPGLAIYAIDVDGRRIIVGASTRAICVLDRYRRPQAAKGREACTRPPKTQV